MSMDSLYLRLLECRWVDLAREIKRWNYVNMSAPYWRLYWNDRPGAYLRLGEERITLGPDVLIILPPNVVFSSVNRRCAHQLYVHFQVLAPFLHPTGRPVVLPMEPALTALKEEVVAAAQDEDGPDWRLSLTAQALANLAFSRAVGSATRVVAFDPRISRAMADMDEALGAQLKTATLARQAGLSADAFIRLFKSQAGQTPQDCLRRKRVEKACLMLHYSEDSIEAIAEATGFCDRYHFTRVFKRIQGVGPAHFRRSHRPTFLGAGKVKRTSERP